jgi:transmembrane sensor
MDNVSEFPNKAAIKEEAGLWIVRMDSRKLEEDEIQELKDWIQQSNFHREYLIKLANNWDAMSVLQELGEMFPLPEKERPASRRSGWSHVKNQLRGILHSPFGMAASGMAALLVVSSLFVVNPGEIIPGQDRGAQEFVTAVGERHSYTLEDGTVVSLNTNTQLQVTFSDARRAINLIQGEATFDVAKNPERPFVVYAGTGLVWAVGTAFNVRHDAGLVDVIVTEGRVKVFSDTTATDDSISPSLDVRLDTNESILVQASESNRTETGYAQKEQREALLGAGEALRYREVIESFKTMEQEESKRILAWHEGSLVFKGETLEQAVAEISRYTDKELIISDDSLKDLRVGGHYKLDDIDALLASLGRGLGISVDFAQMDENQIVLSHISVR